MPKSNRDQRITMVVSTLLAAALLGAAVTAQHGHRQPLSALAELESDLRMQLQMAFRHDTTQHKSRVGQLDKVIDAWLQTPRSPDDRQLLTQWLQQAIRNSMPGSTQPLPPHPLFGSHPNHRLPMESTTPQSSTSVGIDHRSLALSAPAEILHNPHDRRLPPVASSVSATPMTSVKANPVTITPPTPGPAKAISNPSHKTMDIEIGPGDQLGPSANITPTSDHRAKGALFTSRSTEGAKTTTRLTAPPRETLPATKIAINLIELAARTAGYHDGLNEIEATLFQLDELGDSQQRLTLAQRSLRQLQQLVDDYQFIKLYYGQLTEKQRQTISAPRSPTMLCEYFSHCLSQWTTPRKADYLRSFDGDLPESQQTALLVLREDLAALAILARD